MPASSDLPRNPLDLLFGDDNSGPAPASGDGRRQRRDGGTSVRSIIADAANRYGVPADGLARIAQIESSLNPAARNGRSSAGGLFQFIDSTARQYGLRDKFDPYEASDAGARLYRDNANGLKRALGHEPTVGEVYLAHQQGLGGALKLLTHPDAKAVDIVGAKAVRNNGGTADMTAADFANLWMRKATGPGGTYDRKVARSTSDDGVDPADMNNPFPSPAAESVEAAPRQSVRADTMMPITGIDLSQTGADGTAVTADAQAMYAGPMVAPEPQTGDDGAIVIDENYQPTGAMAFGLAGRGNAIDTAAAQARAQAEAAEQERQRQKREAETAVYNRKVEKFAEGLGNPERYALIDEADLPEWQKRWQEENQSSGRGGDFWKNLGTGALATWKAVNNAEHTIRSYLPGGDTYNEAQEQAERDFFGAPVDTAIGDMIAKNEAALSPEGKKAAKETVFDDDSWKLGDALSDPDWYLRQIAQSAAPMAMSMGPSALLARGSFATALASGASREAAAAAAARTATVAGGISEGIIGGAQSADSLREAIAAIPRDQLLQSDAVKSMIEEGMSPDDAINALSNDVQLQAFVTAGVTTGLFGGMGDRALAKIIAEGVGGGIVRRSVRGAARGVVGEGLLEELPQNVTQQISENAAKRRIDPNQSLTEGVGEQAVAGTVVGGVMGGALGGAGAAMRPARSDAPDAAPDAPDAADPTPPPATDTAATGPIGQAVRYAEQEQTRRAGGATDTGIDGKYRPGTTVGVDIGDGTALMGTVQGYEGDDAIVMDTGTGELFQIPHAQLKRVALAPDEITSTSGMPPEQAAPSQPVGTIRVYHSGSRGDGDSGRWVSTDRRYASDYRRDLPLYYLDLPRDDPRVNHPDYPEQSIERGHTFNFELTPAEAARLTKIPREPRQKRDNTPLPEQSNDPALEPQPETPGQTTSEGAPAPGTQKPATARFPHAPEPGARVIVTGPDGNRFPARILSYEEGATEAHVRDDKGREFQAPLDALTVSNQTKAQVEAEDATRNPPAERETAKLTGTRRRVLGKTVEMPDETHARLFDLGHNRMMDKRLFGASALDVSPAVHAEAERVGKGLGISPEIALTLADDYRFRVERAARNAKSELVQHLPGVNRKMLERVRPTKARPQESETAETSPAQWWDALPEAERADLLKAAQIKRAPKTPFNAFSKAIQKKIGRMQPAPEDAPVEDKTPEPATPIDTAAAQAATSPTNDLPEPSDAQREAGNYQHGHIKVAGLDISVEHPAGSTRTGTGRNGQKWSTRMDDHYGYIKGTKDNDGEHLDAYVKAGAGDDFVDGSPAFVVDQKRSDGSFDEHKVMLGYPARLSAEQAYLDHTGHPSEAPTVTQTTLGQLKDWIAHGDMSKPFADAGKRFQLPSTAPEHLHNEGRPLDRDKTYPKPEKGRETTDSGELAGDVVSLTMPVKDFKEVTDEWANLFADPDKRVVTDHRAKSEPVRTPAGARKIIDGWKDDAKKQREEHAFDNSQRTILSLFDYTGQWSQPYEDAGYNVIRFDIQHGDDVMDFSAQYFIDNHDVGDVYGILAATPCTDFASSGSRHFSVKDRDGRTEASKALVFQTLRTIEFFRPKFWALENPVGRIEKLTGLPQARMTFEPYHFGAPYTKKTMLWGKFNAELPLAVVEPTEGSKMHAKYGGKSLRTKNARSETPEGFACAFFKANNYVDLPALARLTGDYPEASGAVRAAYQAGIPEAEIRDAIENAYGNYEYTEARSILARMVAGRRPTPPRTTEKAPKPVKQETAEAKVAPEPQEIATEKSPAQQAAREGAPAPASEGGKAPDASLFANNKLFTADAVEKARARLRAKMRQLNAGFDPELAADGMVIAGAYIEAGVRSFADFAKRMTDDFGDHIKPYLLSFWESARSYPDLDNAGMTSAAESADLHAKLMAENTTKPNPAVGVVTEAPKTRKPRKGKAKDRRLQGDYGVDHIDAYSDEGEAAKAAFLKDARGYLKAVGDQLEAAGFITPSTSKGRRMKAVNVNESGVAGSGDVTLAMRHPETGANVYAHIGEAALRGVVPMSPSGVAIMYRASTKPGDTYATDARSVNRWAPVDLTADELADKIQQEARAQVTSAAPHRKESGNELEGTGAGALAGVPAEAVRGTEDERETGRSAGRGSQPDASGSGAARSERVQPGRSVPDDEGAVSVSAGRREGPAREQPVLNEGSERSGSEGQKDARRVAGDRPRKAETPHISATESKVESAATPAQNIPSNYTLTDADEIGQGGAKTKFKANIEAIKIVRKVTEENRPATAQEQAKLAKWVGWGGLSAAFYREDGTVPKGWEKEAKQLKELLTADEYAAAAASTRNAHYTSPEIVKAIWAVAERLGFKGGRVLEPSVGSGNFLGFMPGNVKSATHVTGVELDAITGTVAKALYPDHNIQAPKGFQTLSVPDGYFDLAIGNPPFGSERLYDAERRSLNSLSIHNYFFAKSVAGLRPGGVLAMVITNSFLDAGAAKARAMIAEQAEFIGAIRLPNNAFAKNAGTEVTTDIVILRKLPEDRAQDDESTNKQWLEIGEYTDKNGNKVPLNRYFIEHPEMMLGDFGAYGTMYGPGEPALIGREGHDLNADLAAALGRLPRNIMPEPGSIAPPEAGAPSAEAADVDVGSFFLDKSGAVHQRLPDRLGEARAQPYEAPNAKAADRVAGMIRIRDAFKRLRVAQIDPAVTDAKLANLRKRLNEVYDAFTADFGPLNLDVNKRLFREDPTWPQLSALEDNFKKGISKAVSDRTGEPQSAPSADKAAVFTKRTQQPYQPPRTAATAQDALAQVLADTGRVDMGAITALYGKSEDEITAELGALIFKAPNGGYETADAYLSGNVKQKLAEAERAAQADPAFRRNVAALSQIQPDDIEPADIDVKPGAPWIPPEHIKAFIAHITETDDPRNTKAIYSKLTGKWELEVPRSTQASDARWATERSSVADALRAAINGTTLQIYDQISRDKRELNQPATEAANEKVARIATEWRNWIWDDDARRNQLARLYNDTFNTTVERRFDGSHLTFPGKVSDDVIKLRPHQSAAVWRTLQSSTTLFDHTVGAGKTFAMIASIMEKRRTGQARKPMITVPNHLVAQWAADFQKLYPGARVLAPSKADFSAANRKRLTARIATGDWDAVIVAHSQFGLLGVSPEIEARFINEQVADIEQSIAELREADGAKSRSVKQMEKQKESLHTKLQKLLDAGRKDQGLYFDELGVDALYVDEFHEFKNLGFATSMQRVGGLGNPAGSKRAADIYMKLHHILAATGGNIVVATGTPLSNSMAEMFTLQRYLGSKVLQQQGISHFDAWARVFGEVVTDWELSPSGQYKMASRFAKFVNIPELMVQYRQFADVITNDDIKRQLAERGQKLNLPEVAGGKPTLIVVKPSPAQLSYIGEGKPGPDGALVYPKGSLVYRAEHLPKGKMQKGADNMLKIMSDARKAALDMRLIYSDAGDYAGSKINRAAAEMKRIYDKWAAQKGTQLVFIDLSTPKKAKAKEKAALEDLIRKADEGDEDAQTKLDNMSPDEFDALNGEFSAYDDLKGKLISLGVPGNEIAFIHDASTDIQKDELFARVRAGRVRFLFGSTPKMGAGTNVQTRLVALHHIDAPWRPSDLEQRDGRIIRQGNMLYDADPDGFRVEILRYATEKTLDARQWQGIETKARFVQQVRKGSVGERSVEDLGGEVASAAEMKAAASGNPLILEEMQTRKKLRTLENQANEHQRQQHRIKRQLSIIDSTLADIAARKDEVEADAKLADEFRAGSFEGTVGGKTFDKHKEFGAALISKMRQATIDGVVSEPQQVGTIGGFSIAIEQAFDNAWDVVLQGSRDHTVPVADITEQDPVGLGRKVANTIGQIATAPVADATQTRQLQDQKPKLEKQIGPWPLQQELEDTTATHRRLIDQLRPQKKATESTPADEAVTPDVAVENKRPDTLTRFPGKQLVAMPVPERDPSVPLKTWAAEAVLEPGRKTGHEHLIAIDDDGAIVAFGTSSLPDFVGLNTELAGAVLNPDRRLVIYHNHPRSTPLSKADLSMLGHPGVYSVWTLGHDGRDTRASLTPASRGFLASNFADPAAAYTSLRDAINAGDAPLRDFLQGEVNDKRLSPALATVIDDNTRVIPVQRAGLIDYTDDTPYDTASIPGLDEVLDAAADTIKEKLYGGKNPRDPGSDRPAKSFRHIAELESVPANLEPVASFRGTEGARETGARYDPRKEGGRLSHVTEGRVIQELKGVLIDWKPPALATIPFNYFPELAQKGMTAVSRYLNKKREMDAYRGRKHEEADKIAGQWLRYSRLGLLGKDKSRAKEISDLMHASTLAGVDPSSADAEMTAKSGYSALHRRYMALPPSGKALFQAVRDAYKAQALELDTILLDNVKKAQEIAQRRARERYQAKLEEIADAGLTGLAKRNAEQDALSAYTAEKNRSLWSGKARITRLRQSFEQSRVPAPYFPLGRFGQYFVTIRDRSGAVVSFSRFEKSADQQRFLKEARRDKLGATIEHGRLQSNDSTKSMMDPRMVAEIEELLGGSGVDPDLMDQIWQRYLETLPDISMRKRYIHRKGTAGYHDDALRVFSSHMFHASHQMARAKFGLDMQELVNETFDQARREDNQEAAMALANELDKRHRWVMNPTGSSVAQTMTSTAFVWYLAGSPASAMVNLSQTGIMGVPILGARFGGVLKATRALVRASLDAVRGKGSVAGAALTADERRAMEVFDQSGLIDRTRSHDLAGVGNTGIDYSPLRARVMSVISWAFHRAEVANREITAMAAYRLAREAGNTHDAAVDLAHEMTWKTHFDYSNSSRPRALQNDVAKVALVFRQFQINMLYRIFRDAYQSFKGDTPQARREARYQLAGVSGMIALMGGLTGSIGYNLIMGLASMVFGDDDDPVDFETRFKADVVDVLGPELGGVVLNGVPGHYLGISLSDRIGMPDLWFRSPYRELEGRDEYYYWLSQSLGATASLAESAWSGLSLIKEGQVARGVEVMAPTAIRNLLKAVRYENEGLVDLRSNQLMSRDQIGTQGVIAQALGFTPAAVAETYDRRNALKNAEHRVKEARQKLINRWALATLTGDDDAKHQALDDIRKFNHSPYHRGVGITSDTLHRSIRTRRSNSARMEDGTLIRNKALNRDLRRELPERVY